MFITLEGIEGSGKTTQIQNISQWLTAAGYDCLTTREPGGTTIGGQIRSVLLHPDNSDLAPMAELMLYEAARVQHTEQVLRPALERGLIAVSERYTLATLAYQGYARGLDLQLVRQLNKIATGGLTPDLTIVLDIPDQRFATRDPDRDLDRLEKESGAFRRKVAAGYRKLAAAEKKVVRLDADRPPHLVHVDIVTRVSILLKETIEPLPLS